MPDDEALMTTTNEVMPDNVAPTMTMTTMSTRCCILHLSFSF
jgi:hypothetical protein